MPESILTQFVRYNEATCKDNSIGKQMVKGFLITLSVHLTTRTLNLATTILLAWFSEPSAMGLVATANLTI